MADDSADRGERDQRLQEVLLAYVEAAENGPAPDREQFLGCHPEFAAELAEFFANQDQFEGLAAPLRWVAQAVLQATPLPGDTPLPGSSDEGDPSSPPTQTRSFGDYELLQEIGRGGMGVVYKAQQRSPRRLVALKMIRAGQLAPAADLQRFRNEADAAAWLDHPHIVPIYEVGEHEGWHYFSMKLMEGGSLTDVVAKSQESGVNKEECRRAAQVVATIARAVHHAHQRGILHRDLKPANVLLDKDGQPHVTDFGLSRRVAGAETQPGEASLTQSGQIVGTPGYMAPEQASGKRRAITTATDVYGLGAVLYALLAGRPPFRGETVLDTLTQVKERDPEPPSGSSRQVDRELQTICLKCLEKEPPKRYSSAEAVAEDLERWLAGKSILARPIGRMARLWRWCRRNPVLAGATCLAILAFAAVAGLSVGFAVYQSRSAARLLSERRQAEELAAGLALDQGLSLCEQGQIGAGMLWFARSLDIATLAEATDLEWAIRQNLAAWYRRLNPLRACLEHQGPVLCVAFSPDGRTAFTGSEDGTVRSWDAATGKALGFHLQHQGGVRALALSRDGQMIATVSGDGTDQFGSIEAGYSNITYRRSAGGIVQLWEVATGKPQGPPRLEWGRVYSLTFGPDGDTIVTGNGDKTARLWHTRTGKPYAEPMLHPGPVWAVAMSPDGRNLLTASYDGGARLWDAATGKPRGNSWGVQHGVWAVAFSPDGEAILAGCGDFKARLWKASSGELLLAPLQHQEVVSAVAFSPDNRTVLTGSQDNTARLWRANTGQPVGQPLPHRSVVQAVAFGQDARLVLTGSWEGTARLWQMAPIEPLDFSPPHRGALQSITFGADGRSVLVSSDEETWLCDAVTGKPIRSYRDRSSPPLQGRATDRPPRVASLSYDGRTMVTNDGDGHLQLWETDTGRLIRSLGRSAQALALSPDGKFLLIGSDNRAELWETATDKMVGKVMEHQSRINAVAFSPDGRLLLTRAYDQTARLWEATTCEPAGDVLLHAGRVSNVAFSPDGRTVLTATREGIVQRWETATGKPVGRPLQDRGGAGASAALGPDGRTILLVRGDARAQLWDVVTGRTISPPFQHYGPVRTVAFNPFGKQLLTVAPDSGTAWAWEWPPPMTGEVEKIQCQIQVVTGMEVDGDGVVHVLDAPTWRERCRHLEELAGRP